VLVAAISCEGELSLQGSADADVVAHDDGAVEADVGRETPREAEAGDEVDAGVDADARPDADVEAEADVMSEADAAIDAATDVAACDDAWRDPTTGYLWEHPPSDATMNWDAAVVYCDGLTLCGYGAGSWHLPDIDELRTLIRGCPNTETGGACGVTDSCLSCWSDACGMCPVLGGPAPEGCAWDVALGPGCLWYVFWSSSSCAGSASCAWGANFYSGNVGTGDKSDTGSARCVHRDS
jgi:hypothetical protein